MPHTLTTMLNKILVLTETASGISHSMTHPSYLPVRATSLLFHQDCLAVLLVDGLPLTNQGASPSHGPIILCPIKQSQLCAKSCNIASTASLTAIARPSMFRPRRTIVTCYACLIDYPMTALSRGSKRVIPCTLRTSAISCSSALAFRVVSLIAPENCLYGYTTAHLRHCSTLRGRKDMSAYLRRIGGQSLRNKSKRTGH